MPHPAFKEGQHRAVDQYAAPAVAPRQIVWLQRAVGEALQFLRDELATQRGCAVILATHNAEEAFELCDRVAILDRGRMLASGVAAQLAREFMGVRYRLTTTEPEHPALRELSASGIDVSLQGGPDAGGSADAWHDIVLRMEPRHDPAGVLSMLAGRGMRIAAFEPIRPSLADLIEGVVNRGSVS